jgi:type I restriction enzyme, S subunit
MVGGWRDTTIGELGRVVTGKTPPTSRTELFGEDYPFITPTDIDGPCHAVQTERFVSEQCRDFQKNLLLPTGTVCFVCIGATIGKICLTNRPSFTNQQINSVIVDERQHDPWFVYNLLRHEANGIKGIAGGAATPIVNKTAFSNFPVRVPSLDVERKIGAVLAAYDELIENNTRRIKLLEQMAQALYREWFVRPCHSGNLPKGWETKRVADVATLLRGKSYRSEDLAEEGGLPFLNLKCMDRDGGFRLHGIKRFCGEFKDHHTAKAGDIVIAVTDMTQERRIVARAARVPRTAEPLYVMSMDLVRLAPKPGIPDAYLYAMLRYSEFSDEVKQHANGVNVLHLSPDRIEQFEFSLPDHDKRTRFGDLCQPILEQCDVLNLKNANLRRTRDLLLPKLISGEVSVP